MPVTPCGRSDECVIHGMDRAWEAWSRGCCCLVPCGLQAAGKKRSLLRRLDGPSWWHLSVGASACRAGCKGSGGRIHAGQSRMSCESDWAHQWWSLLLDCGRSAPAGSAAAWRGARRPVQPRTRRALQGASVLALHHSIIEHAMGEGWVPALRPCLQPSRSLPTAGPQPPMAGTLASHGICAPKGSARAPVLQRCSCGCPARASC